MPSALHAHCQSPRGGGAEEEEEGGSGGGKGEDIDAIFEALVAKTKGTGATTVAPPTKESGGGAALTLKSAAAAVPVREGDGGYGVDLARPWSRYDAKGTGSIPCSSLRGLLTDLGAYTETGWLVQGARDANVGVSSSEEGAAQVGTSEWRLHAAIDAMDPKGTGKVSFTDFSDWWK